MNRSRYRLSASLLLILSAAAQAGYEVPNAAYNAPATYYNAAAGSGDTLKLNLHNIISTMTQINYGDARYALGPLYQDPNNAANVILTYTRTSASATWDNGVTWNREHLWPQSKLGISVSNTYKGPGSDLFELRPADSSTNSSRGNKGFGGATTTGGYSSTSTSFFPGDADKGDVARAMFYMATRYYTPGAAASSTNLSLVNSTSPGTYQMGDLNSLLHWNYQDGVDNFERRANQMIYAGWTNNNTHATQAQGNRNPYVDHPEYVWAVFGGGNNDSQITASTSAASVGRVMKNGTFGSASVTVNKTGADPTTFNTSTTGNATIAAGSTMIAGVGQTFDYGTQSRTITAQLNASTATVGAKSGTIVIDNTDLTSGGAGMGSADANETITVSGSVLDKRVVASSTPTVNFDTVVTGATVSNGVTLTTTGDDDSATRVNVAGTSAVDANGMRVNGTTALFNAANSTSARTVTGTLSGAGAKSGTLALGVTSAENGGAGLTGEGTYSGVNVGYTATVLAHSNASFSAGSDKDSLAIDFGQLTQGAAAGTQTFNIANLIATAGFTAGLDLTGLSASGSNLFTTNLNTFTNEAAGQSLAFQAMLNTSTVGNFSATYQFFVSDQQTLTGATAGAPLTLTLTGQVVAVPEPAAIAALLLGSGVLLRRRRM